MKLIVLSFPIAGFALRVEFVPLARRTAVDTRPNQIPPTLKTSLRAQLVPYLLQDIGVDDSRRG
jgi:hypothetical protein